MKNIFVTKLEVLYENMYRFVGFPGLTYISRKMVVQLEPGSESPEPFRTVTLLPGPGGGGGGGVVLTQSVEGRRGTGEIPF